MKRKQMCWKAKLRNAEQHLPLWVAVSAHWQRNPMLQNNVGIFTEWSSFHREHLFYVIIQNQRYILRCLLANTNLHTYTKHLKIIPTVAQFPLMQCNWPKHTCFAGIAGSGHHVDSHRIRVTPSLWLCISLWCYFHRLCWLTDINTANSEAINKALTVWYLLPWRTCL